jgi:hypothetical protein
MTIESRVASIALAIFVSGLAGFLLQGILPAQLVADGKSMVALVAGLVALLLALVLGLVIWSSYGVYSTQVAEGLSLGPIVLQLDVALEKLGAQGVRGRELLKSQVIAHRDRFWGEARATRASASYQISRTSTRDMAEFFATVTPETDEEKAAFATAKQLSASMIQTQLLMARQLASPVPPILVYMVVGWAMLLFLANGFVSPFNSVSFVAAALGAAAISSALLLIFELSQPYDGRFRISPSGAEQVIASIGPSSTRGGGKTK